MNEPENIDRTPTTRSWQQFLIVFLLGTLLIWISWKFIIPVLMGATISVVLSPLVRWLECKKWGTSLAALAVTLGTTIVIFLPTTFLIVAGTKTGMKQLKSWKESPFTQGPNGGQDMVEGIMSNPAVDKFTQKIATTFNLDVAEITSTAADLAKSAGMKLADILGSFLGQIPSLVLSMFLLIVAIYYFLVDGDKVAAFFRRNSVFDPTSTDELIKSFNGICSSTLLATVASGMAQSLTFLIGMIIVGADQLLLTTLIVFLFSFIPVIGAAPATLGAALIYVLQSDSTGLSVVIVIFALVTGIIDNFVRPFVLRAGGTELHPLLSFIGLFGGVEAFGFYGLFLGPIIVEMFRACLMAHIRANNRGVAV